MNMITSANLQNWIQHPELLDRDTLYQLRTMMDRFPYFPSLRLLLLKNLYLLHNDDFGNELRKSAIYVADRRVLFQLIEGAKYVFSDEKEAPEEEKVTDKELGLDRTLSLIDRFLEVKPREKNKPTAPVNYATDYAAYLLQEEEDNPIDKGEMVPKSRDEELIDGFIENSNGEFKITPDSPDEVMPDPVGPKIELSEDDDSCFTETLAKIYIKQRRYEKAIEIIRKLNLKNPKKNAYFADQIRFLEKLIINAKMK
jgi:tetratricopeptide (TPR) repeat protein